MQTAKTGDSGKAVGATPAVVAQSAHRGPPLQPMANGQTIGKPPLAAAPRKPRICDAVNMNRSPGEPYLHSGFS